MSARHAPPNQRGLVRPPPQAGNSTRSGALHRVTSAAVDPAVTGRPLTSGEVELLRPLFGDSLDYTAVRVFNKKYTIFQANNVAMSPDGHIYLPPGSGIYTHDFSAASVGIQALFVHEMTHVWQHQSGHNVLLEAGMLHLLERDPYAYQLGRSFDEYNLEQQGDIIRHYFLLTKHPDWATTYGMSAPLAEYQRTLEHFLADPSYRRRDNNVRDQPNPFDDETAEGDVPEEMAV